MQKAANQWLGLKKEIQENGYAILAAIYTNQEMEQLLATINSIDSTRDTFRKSVDLFAIRQFLKEIPSIQSLIFNKNLKQVIQTIFDETYFVVKSIYFDKPEKSNWFVAYHQDLTISVDQKVELENYGPWTVKQNQFAVQPPLNLLENNFTIRIHLDDTDENNGALKVIPKSHKQGVIRTENFDFNLEKESICSVPKGGIMIMKPLLLHASNKTTNHQKRRVIHIEFANAILPHPLCWSEKLNINYI